MRKFLLGATVVALSGLLARCASAQTDPRARTLLPVYGPTTPPTTTPSASGLGDDLSYRLARAAASAKRLADELPRLPQGQFYTAQQIERIAEVTRAAARESRAAQVLTLGARLVAGSRSPMWSPDIGWSSHALSADVGMSWLVGSTDRGFGVGGRAGIAQAGDPYDRAVAAFETELLATSRLADGMRGQRPSREARSPDAERALLEALRKATAAGQAALEAFDRSVTVVRLSLVGSYGWYNRGREIGAVGLAVSQLAPLGSSRPCAGLWWHVAFQGVQRRFDGLPTKNALRAGLALAWQDRVPHATIVPGADRDPRPGDVASYRWTTRIGLEYVGGNRVDGSDLVALFVRKRDPETGVELTAAAGKDPSDRAFATARLGWSCRF